MRFKKIVKMFDYGSVCVCGMRGRGKDMLMSNVVVRRKLPYVSNIDYGGDYNFFDYSQINLSNNTYRDFIHGTVKKYVYPYPDFTDIYLSDCGVYYPSQYCNELNKQYPSLPLFCALSRQLGECNVHFNVQNLNRVWDKIREHSDIYVLANWCKVLFGRIVIQKVTIYDKYESAVARVKPNRIKIHFWDLGENRLRKQMYVDTFENNHGSVKSRWLVYINKSKYDTRHFKGVLANGS